MANYPYATMCVVRAFMLLLGVNSSGLTFRIRIPPTSDPEETRVQVQDERLDWLFKTYGSKTKIPAALTCVDIAGLTRGAS